MDDMLYYFIRRFGNVLGIMGIATGFGLIFFPKTVAKINNFLNKRISIEHVREKLEKDIDITSWILKTHIIMGIIVLITSLLLLINTLRL